MFSDFDVQTRQMLTGNLLMIGCCIFYLAWWLITFKPQGAVKSLRSGWLLVPALLFGVAAVVRIVQGSGAVESSTLSQVTSYQKHFGMKGMMRGVIRLSEE